MSKETQQKQKLILTGGLGILCLILVIAVIMFAFGGCGVNYAEADTNTVFVLKNGKIVSTDVEAFDEGAYSTSELEAYLKDIVDTYNAGSEETLLKQKSLVVEENVATLVLEYANTDVYEDINGVELFTGTLAEALEAGYSFDGDFAKIEEDLVTITAAQADDFVNGEDYKVVIIKSNTKVVVPGKVCYVSLENIAEVGEDYVLIKEGSLLATEDVFENTEFGTEAEGSDGSISEEEMANGDGDIIFDFGDVEESESQYSEVLTFIIYK